MNRHWVFHVPPVAGPASFNAMLLALGAEISEGNGSRVRIKLNGVWAVFHRPHPHKETDKGAVKALRQFLESAGVSKNG